MTVVRPTKYVSIVGGDAVFHCFTDSRTDGTQWIVNGSSLENITNALTQFTPIPGSGVGTLTFSNLSLSYNVTSIQCISNLQEGNAAHSNTATLLIQGLCILKTMLLLYIVIDYSH